MGTAVSKAQVTTHHFFFGQVAVKNEFNKELIVIFKKLVRQDEFQEWERGYRQTSSMNKDSLLLPDSFEKDRIKKYFACCECPADFEMSITLERFDNLFKKQLSKREANPSKIWYKEQELFLILYELAGGVKQFQVKGFRFGDIRPSQMVITSTTKKIKMINIYSYPEETSAVDKILDKYDKKTIFYLAPEEIKFLESPSRTSNIPNTKTEAFSLGLTILEAAILQNSQDLYTLNPRTIDLKLLQKRISILQQKYPLLKPYVAKLLAEKPEERFSCGEIWSVLNNYSEKITLLQHFNKNESAESKSLQHFRRSG